MKKTIVVLIALLSVLLSLPTSAASTSNTSIENVILEEVNDLVDISKYPVNANDNGIYLLSLVEHGYSNGVWGKDNSIYLYFYNPSRKTIKKSDLNTVQMACEWKEGNVPSAFKKYGLQVEGSALDGLYIRAKVTAPATSIVRVNNGNRIYGVTEFELLEDSKLDIMNSTNAQSYKVGYVYSFSGSGETLKCELTSFLTLTLNVGHTSYLSGNSAFGGGIGYSNQASSVYFSIPREVEKKYGLLYDVKYEYFKVRSAPIFVTTDQEFYDELIKVVGEEVKEEEWDSWPIMIKAGNSYGDKVVYSLLYGRDYKVNIIEPHYKPNLDMVSLGFLTDKIESGYVMVTSEELQEYFNSYSSSFGTRNDNTSTYRGYSTDLFDFSAYVPYKVEKTVTRDEDFSLPSYGDTHQSWWSGVWDYGIWYNPDKHDDSFDNIPYIQSLSEADFEDDDFSSNFLVSSTDVSDVKTYTRVADRNNENTYILHFAIEDDYAMNCAPELPGSSNQSEPNIAGYCQYVNGTLYSENGDVRSAEVSFFQTDVYLDFDIISLGFSDDGKDITTFGVVMTPIDVFPDLEGSDTEKDPPPPPEEWDPRPLIAVILIAGAVLLVIFLIDNFQSVQMAVSNANMQRQLKNQERLETRRRELEMKRSQPYRPIYPPNTYHGQSNYSNYGKQRNYRYRRKGKYRRK